MNQADVIKWGGVLILFFVVYKLLNKMGLLGETADEKGAKELLGNPVINGDSNAPKEVATAVAKAQGKTPTKVTAEDIKKYMPTSSTMLKWLTQLKDAAGNFNDDETQVYSIFRQMKNQVSLYAFSQFFLANMDITLLDYIADFMNDSELNTVNSIIKNLPKV